MTRALGAAALGAGLVLAGLAFDSPSLHVPGLALLALGAGAAGWVLAAVAGARVERKPGPHTVQEEEPYPLRIDFTSGLVPPPGGEIREPVLDHPVRLWRTSRRRVRVQVRFSRRGRRLLEPARVLVFDPLRLARRELSSGDPSEIIVLPRTLPVVALDGGGPGGAATRSGASFAQAASEVELDSLRPYREGAPASRIHWPTVARTGDLVERRLVADADTRPLVVLDARRPRSEEALDRAVRATASLAVSLAAGGGCGVMLPGDRRPTEIEADLHGWPALHVRLAVVEPGGETPGASRLHRAGALFWVTAAPVGRLPAALERAPATARILVTPNDYAGTPAFEVAGCLGYRVGRGTRRAAA